jgi:spore maturation protein B
MVGVSMVSASGFVELLSGYLEPLGEKVGVPIEIIPLIILRPISGSGSNAVLADIFEKYGVDSFASSCASVLMASSETMIYVITVYFSSIKVKKTGYAIPAAVIIMLLCIYLSCFVCRRLLF